MPLIFVNLKHVTLPQLGGARATHTTLENCADEVHPCTCDLCWSCHCLRIEVAGT
jgi:hypothetical protein